MALAVTEMCRVCGTAIPGPSRMREVPSAQAVSVTHSSRQIQVGVGDPGRVVSERLGQLHLPDDRRNRLAAQDADVELHAVLPAQYTVSRDVRAPVARRTKRLALPGSTRCGRVSRMRGAADYIASLRDGRAVFLDGERVDDVTAHPAFAEAIRRVAERYEAARERRTSPSAWIRTAARGSARCG